MKGCRGAFAVVEFLEYLTGLVSGRDPHLNMTSRQGFYCLAGHFHRPKLAGPDHQNVNVSGYNLLEIVR